MNQKKLLAELKAQQQGVLDNYFAALRLKSQLNAVDKTSSKKSKTQNKSVSKSTINSQY